jgi:hypothetical protein
MINLNELGNFKKVSDTHAVLIYDANIYSMNVLSEVAQYMIGKCKASISHPAGDSTKILVEITDDKGGIEKVVDNFNEEVINYSFYMNRLKSENRIREMILERILFNIKNDSTEEDAKLPALEE